MDTSISKYEAECLVEVDSVLCRLDPKELKKIPLEVRDAINESKSNGLCGATLSPCFAVDKWQNR